MTTLRLIRLAAALSMAAALAGCSLFGGDDDDISLEEMPPASPDFVQLRN